MIGRNIRQICQILLIKLNFRKAQMYCFQISFNLYCSQISIKEGVRIQGHEILFVIFYSELFICEENWHMKTMLCHYLWYDHSVNHNLEIIQSDNIPI